MVVNALWFPLALAALIGVIYLTIQHGLWVLVSLAAVILIFALTGCITAEDRATIDLIAADQAVRSGYSRAQVDAINAEVACKNMARNLVQMARCEVRR